MHITQAEQDQLGPLIDEYKNDIPLFAVSMFGSQLRPKQVEFWEAFRLNRRITFRGGVGFGKTHAMAVLVWWALITHNQVQVTIFGPNEGQIKSGVWKEINILYDRMPEFFKAAFSVTGTRASRVSGPSDCFAEYRLCNKDNIAATRGIHQVNNFVFVDEATGVDEIIFTDSLNNIFSDPNAKLCLISNPDTRNCYFYRTFNDDTISDAWTKVHGSFWDNTSMDEERLTEMARQYGGETSRQYRIMIEGEFPLDDENGLISAELVQRAVSARDVIPAPNTHVVWGLDPAGDGKGDRSVLCKRQDNRVLEVKEWRGLNAVQLAEAVLAEITNNPNQARPAVIFVDKGGLGHGVWSVLHNANKVRTVGVFANNKPTRDVDLYFNMRTQLWWECRKWLEDGNVSLPNNKHLIEELCTPTYSREKDKLRVEPKEQMKKRLRGSPDYADALCLTFYEDADRHEWHQKWTKAIDYGDQRWAE